MGEYSDDTSGPDEERIRARAYALWEAEGFPDGQHERHWLEAREIVALEDSQQSTLKPVPDIADVGEPVEPALAVDGAADVPGLTDQGEDSGAPQVMPARTARRGR